MCPLSYTEDGLPYYTPDPETANPLYDAAPPQAPAEQPLPVDASAMTFNDSTGSTAFDKLLGVGGQERYQTWPEKMVRDAIAAPHDVLNNSEPQTSEDLIKPAMDIASLAGSGGLATGLPEGAIGSVGSKLVQPAMKDAPVFYSAVENAVKNSTQNIATPDQWIGFLKNQPGVKQEELQWMGLDDPANLGSQPITKTDLENYVQNHKVELQEVDKKNLNNNDFDMGTIRDKTVQEHFGINNEEWDGFKPNEINQYREQYINNIYGGQPTKFSQYQLPGGFNYKEKLLTLPNEWEKFRASQITNDARIKDLRQQMHGTSGTNEIRAEISKLQNENQNLQKQIREAPIFKSSHWDEPNVLAHVRMNDRNIDGKKFLHIDEAQSDLHQKGNAEGYKISDKQKQELENIDQKLISNLDEKDIGNPDINEVLKTAIDKKIISQAEAQKYKDYSKGENSNIPDFPFKKDRWLELVLKRVIREAAEKNYDRVSWTPGEVQADRYDLSKHLDSVGYEKRGELYNISAFPKKGNETVWRNDHATIQDIENNLGKEIAKRIENGIGRQDGKLKYLEDLNLKVGGEFHKELYDKKIPRILEKLGKDHGVKIKQSEIEITKNGKKYKQPVQYIDLPQSFKDVATGKGFPLFSSGVMLSPVEHDPYQRKLTPVEHDPFRFTPVENNPFEE